MDEKSTVQRNMDKRNKIQDNYDTIKVLSEKLNTAANSEQQHKSSKRMTRTAYSKLIMDISNKVNGQSEELDSVVRQIRTVKRDLRSLNEKIDRSLTLAKTSLNNETQESNDRDWGRSCDLLLKILQDHCKQLVSIIEVTAETKRHTKILKDELANLS